MRKKGFMFKRTCKKLETVLATSTTTRTTPADQQRNATQQQGHPPTKSKPTTICPTFRQPKNAPEKSQPQQ
jgi:hypothetical protein